MNRKVSVAPMMDCTDRHERYFLRLISKNTLLYTEMVVDEAINRCYFGGPAEPEAHEVQFCIIADKFQSFFTDFFSNQRKNSSKWSL